MKKIEKKRVVGIVLCIITVILLGVTLFVPWWSMKMESKTTEISMSTKNDYGLQEVHSEWKGFVEQKQTTKYSDKKVDVALDDQIKVYDTTFYIMIAALVSAIVSLLCLILVRIKKMSAKLGVIFLMITMILTILAPVYFAATLPTAIGKDYDDMTAATEEWGFGSGMFEWKPGCTESFAGMEEKQGPEFTWGPSYGWFLTVAAFVLVAVCSMLMILPSRKPKSVPIKIKRKNELPVSSRLPESYPEPLLPQPKNSMKTRIGAIGIVVIVVVGIVACVYLSWPVKITEGGGGGGGEVKIINVTHEPQNPLPGENVTVIATIENCTIYNTDIEYEAFFGHSTGWGDMMGTVSNNTYTHNIGSFSNGTEVWCILVVRDGGGNVITAEHTIQVGHVERSDITSLTILNVHHSPQNPTTEDTSVTVWADITSDVNISSVEMVDMRFSSYGVGSGSGGMMKESENTYRSWIHLSGLDGGLPKGTKVFYKIAAQDESGNTAVSPTFSFTVS